jgi:hypothetical protein
MCHLMRFGIDGVLSSDQRKRAMEEAGGSRECYQADASTQSLAG